MGFSGVVNQTEVVVLIVPFPAQGHLNQLLHLSRLIAAYEIPVHYVGTTTHNRQARRRIQGWDPKTNSNVHFHEFGSLSFQSPPPNPHSPVKFPSHLQPMFEASLLLRRPVKEFLSRLSAKSRRVVIIYDSLMGSVIQDFVDLPNAESYVFHSISAFSIFFFLWESMGRPFDIDGEMLENLPSLEGCFTPEFSRFIRKQHAYVKLNSGRIYNTCRAIEGEFLDLLTKLKITPNEKQFALGPFNPVTNYNKLSSISSGSCHKCLKWLDKHGPNSVLFVSFGTTTSLSDEQIQELAIGLEKSEVKFIWVLRDADRGDVLSDGEVEKSGLPKGFEERVQERGVIVRDWAPQLDILGHVATGGFLTHCGWNSCMESISMGVPILAWPMHSDQPRNMFLLTKVFKIGVAMKDWGFRDELVNSSVVEICVRKLMGSKEGDEMRKRAAELGGTVRKAAGKGGVSRLELDSFISHITR